MTNTASAFRRASAFGTIALFVIACVLLPFQNGRYSIPLIAWIGPVFLLRFTRLTRAWVGLPLTAIAVSCAALVMFDGMFPAEGAAVYVICLATGVAATLPYALDKWLAPRVAGFAVTFVFPCAVVSVEYLSMLGGGYGSWGASAYAQYGFLPLMQLASVTGLSGITFVVSWLASVANWAWDRKFAWDSIRAGVVVFAGAVLSILMAGEARLMFAAPTTPRERVAGIVVHPAKLFSSDAAAERFYSGRALTGDELAFSRAAFMRSNDALLARSEREALAGARLIAWNEVAAMVMKDQETAFLGKAAELAKRHRTILAVALLRYTPGTPKPVQNKIVLIDSHGTVAFEFWKARPLPGFEEAMMEWNNNPMKFADTALGRIGGFVCFDMDFPEVVQQAGVAGTDILIVPANDWRAINPWHSRMAVFRAVENGTNLLRVAARGQSIAADYQGRILAETDYYRSADHVLVAHLPVRGVRTIYSRIGDAFALICLAGLAVLPLGGMLRLGTKSS